MPIFRYFPFFRYFWPYPFSIFSYFIFVFLNFLSLFVFIFCETARTRRFCYFRKSPVASLSVDGCLLPVQVWATGQLPGHDLGATEAVAEKASGGAEAAVSTSGQLGPHVQRF